MPKDWFGNNSDEIFFGTSGDDAADASGGNDVLYGLGGDDALVSQGGDDFIVGGAGADFLDGGIGLDTASYADSAGGVTIAIGGTGTGGDAQGDELSVSFENLIGSGADDTLTGETAANLLIGGAGNDELTGRSGYDTLQGGAGDDVLRGEDGADKLSGGSGIDLADYFTSKGQAGVTVAIGGTGSGGDATGDKLAADIENILGTADFDDVLTGSSAEGDLIVLKAIDADTTVDGDQAFTFIGDGTFTGTAGELRFAHVANHTYAFFDNDGDGSAEFNLRIDGLLTLVESDFVL